MANQPQNRDADRRVAMGVGLFRVGMLVFITGMVFFVGNASGTFGEIINADPK